MKVKIQKCQTGVIRLSWMVLINGEEGEEKKRNRDWTCERTEFSVFSEIPLERYEIFGRSSFLIDVNNLLSL